MPPDHPQYDESGLGSAPRRFNEQWKNRVDDSLPEERLRLLPGVDAEGRCERNCPDFERDPLFSTVLARRLLGAEPWPEAMPGNAETSRTPLHSRAVYLSPHSRPYVAGAGPASL